MFVTEKEQGEVTEAPAKVLDEASKILLRAAEIVEDRGLCKNALTDARGSVCVNGAILTAMFGSPHWDGDRFPIFRACEANKRMQSALNLCCPSIWNNAAERTQAEVVSKLRAVALGL